MDFNKIRKFCTPFRVLLGLALIATGVVTANYWFFLGIIPLVAGLTKFCPLCSFTNKCDIPQDKE